MILYNLQDPFFTLKVLDDCPGDLDFWYRHISKGAWPFSTADHGWPISDCTAEGLKVGICNNHLQSIGMFQFLLTYFCLPGSSSIIKATIRASW